MEENVIQINVGITINVDVSVKNVMYVKNYYDYVWNRTTCSCEYGKYLASIMDDSVIMCDEIIQSYNQGTKTVTTNFNEKNILCRT